MMNLREYVKLWIHGFLLSIVIGIVLFVSGLMGLGFLAILSPFPSLPSALLFAILWLIVNIAIVPFIYGYASRALSEWLHQ